MKLAILSIVVVALALGSASAKISYDNYKVYRFNPVTDEQRELLNTLERENPGVNFWKNSKDQVDIMFPPHLSGDILETLTGTHGLKSGVFIDNVQKLIEEEEKGVAHDSRRVTWTAYHSTADIYQFLRDTAAEFPTICTLINIGQSFEGRDLFVLKISSGAGKPGIWIDANIHAREWITNAIGTYTINELLRSTDPETRRLTEDFDWYIMPMMNPDGYEYSRNTDRMWRKTRSTTTSPLGCRGADPNRNWGYTWNQGGSSPNPCTDTFMGATAFSEPENAAANTYFATIAGQVKFYLSLHSYSQLILLPYGHNNNRIPQYNEWMRIGNLAAAAFRQRFGTNFRVGNIVDLLYVASGGSMDHVLGTHGTALTYTFEMRDTGSYGFLLPPAQIVPSCLEFMDALHAIVNEVRQMN